MKEKINMQALFKVYEEEIAKNTKNKNKIVRFEKNKMQNMNYLIKRLRRGDYFIHHYNIFMICEPKFRIVMYLPIKDKIVNHYVTRNILEPQLSKYLDPRNIATRKGMGTDFGIRKVKQYLELNKKYDSFYILKMDIQKYFYSIDHVILKKLLQDKLSDFDFQLLSHIIDSTNMPRINEIIETQKDTFLKKFPSRKAEIQAVPLYKKGKGLPIGNMTSQFLSIFYLYSLDHFIVHHLKIKHYIRYMDDFIFIHPNPEYLKEIRDKVIAILEQEYCLKVNQKKTKIVSAKEGFTFLGYTFKVSNKKTILKVNRKTSQKVIKSIRRKKYEFQKGYISYEQAFSSISTFKYSFKYGNSMRIQNAIEKYWFED